MKKHRNVLILNYTLGILILTCSVFFISQATQKTKIVHNIAQNDTLNSAGEYTFLVTGHIYGAPRLWESVEGAERDGVFPASSMIAFVDDIKKIGPEFLVLMGDSVISGKKDNYNALHEAVLEPLDIPTYSAIGNHDVMKAKIKNAQSLHTSYFGPLYHSFQKGTEYFIFLDTGASHSAKLDPKQLTFIQNEIRTVKKSNTIKNVFIFTHKLVWVGENEELEKTIYWFHPKYKTHVLRENNISEVFPAIVDLAHNKNVFWGSGDIKDLYPAFYYHDTRDNITYFANSLNDSKDDLMFQINIDKKSQITFDLISLFDNKKKDPQDFGPKLWTSKRDY